MVEFLRIDRDLIEVAAAGSGQAFDARVDEARWVAGLSGTDRDALLVELLAGNDPLLRAATLRRAGAGRRDRAGVRTAAELLDQAVAQRERREQAERDRRAARAAESDGAWARVAARIAEKTPSGYDIAVNLLVDLQEVCDSAVLASRVESLRREHGRKVTFIQRLSNVRL
jgi:hypothetical protein